MTAFRVGDVQAGLLDSAALLRMGALGHASLPPTAVVSAITLAELSARPHETDEPVERARLMNVLQHTESVFDPLPFDAPAARAYGQIVAAVRARAAPAHDTAALLVAATALCNDLPLYTARPQAFTGLEDLITVVDVTPPGGTALG